MTVAPIKEMSEQVKKSIDLADDTTVKMIQAMLNVQQDEAETKDAYEAEMERRFAEMEEGKGIQLTPHEFIARVKDRYTQKMRSAK